MLKLLVSLGLAVAAVAAPPGDKGGDKGAPPGAKVPEFNALKWYNTAPLTLDDLKGKAVLLQVFRTW
jgi:hypothetical protein